MNPSRLKPNSATTTEPRALVIAAAQNLSGAAALRALEQSGWRLARIANCQQAIGTAYDDPPDLLLIHAPMLTPAGRALLSQCRREILFAAVPMLLLVDDPAWLQQQHDWQHLPVDDWLLTDAAPAETNSRVALCLGRSRRALDPNPLTRLPGNTSILHAIQHALDARADVAFCYFDLDYFKAFNDRYGFARGDEILRMTGKVIDNTVSALRSPAAFVGHVGGDDFVCIVPLSAAREVCAQITARFGQLLPGFYDSRDLQQQGFSAADRDGTRRHFPLMGLSIAVIPNHPGRFTHYGEVSARASEVKKAVKSQPGSHYLIDRRQ